MDLGADGFQTFRHVLLPNIATALLAGGMLAFALSFDEVIVTTFTAGQQTTLPIWMLCELVRPRQRPVTNVVAVFVIAVTLRADPGRLPAHARRRGCGRCALTAGCLSSSAPPPRSAPWSRHSAGRGPAGTRPAPPRR